MQIIDKTIRDYLTNFEYLPYGIAVVKNDSFSTLIQANPAFYKLIGHTKEQLQENYENRISDILIDNVYPVIEKSTTNGDRDFEWDLRVYTADGSVAWVHDFAHYNSELNVFFVTLTNLTDKMIATGNHLSYEAFQTKHEILLYLSKYTSEHIIVSDVVTDQIVYMNSSAMKLSGLFQESDWLGKTYPEVAFGSQENIPSSYYEQIKEGEFTSREYYNKFHQKYTHVETKIIKIPTLKRKMRLNIITDITAQKKLEHKIALQKTLHDCVDALFTTTATSTVSEAAYYDILNRLKAYYSADRAFFYKFKGETYEIHNFYEVLSHGLKEVNHTLPIIVTDQQVKLMKELSESKVAQNQSILDSLDPAHTAYLMQLHSEYQINTFSCIAVNNAAGNIVAFMGVTNPQLHEDNKELMELLSRFICMFIEHQQDQVLKEETLKLESISKATIVETCVTNFQNVAHSQENITDTLNALCRHYDADFSVILSYKEDGSCGTSYVGGQAIPDLTALQNQATSIMERWMKTFKEHPEFASDADFVDLNTANTKKILNEKYGIYNFIVSPLRDVDGAIIGLLFVNNFKLLNRSRLIVHIVAKNISDYLGKITMYEKTQLEPLTRLVNKVATENQISKFLEDGIKGTLFLIDIDNFKELNDTLGHNIGDKAIVDLAGILKQIFRSSDVIGRIGGDEFMVFSPGLISHSLITRKANQILQKCNCHYEKDGLSTEISASIGICPVDCDCKTFQFLYEKSDYALYMAKKNGKNQYHIYTNTEYLCDTNEENEIRSYHAMVSEFKSAIQDRRFVVHYQPIYHVPTATFTQAEALIRIKKKDGSLIYPNEFIQIANTTGLVVEMTYQMLEQVCHDFRKLLLQQPDTSLTSISINVPYLQFIDPNMEDRFMEILKNYSISPRQIKIEITERILITDLDLMTKKMTNMKAKGFEFELDDFGTDYSNLQMCIALPLEVVKLDRSLLLAALTSDSGRRFFQHILSGIHDSGRKTILEGVETQAQLDWATECACEYIQGHYFSEPIDFESFSKFLLS